MKEELKLSQWCFLRNVGRIFKYIAHTNTDAMYAMFNSLIPIMVTTLLHITMCKALSTKRYEFIV